MNLKTIWSLLKTTFWHWWNDNTFRLGAALAYYTVFSIGPIILIAITLAGWLFHDPAARQHIIDEISATVGPQVGRATEDMMRYSAQSGSGTWAWVVSVGVLLVGATGVFTQLQDALNTIWGVKPKQGQALWDAVKGRLWSFAMVLGIGFLLLVSLVITTALAAVAKFLSFAVVPGSIFLWQALNWCLSLVLITLLFAMIYKTLPDMHIAWGDVWIGAAVTALLFTIGKYLIGLYLGQSSVVSAYGAAGSLVLILLWVYYSSQILLFGAVFTQVYASRSGKPLVPAANARPVTAEARARQGMTAPHPLSR
jgi:membrane protein